MGIFINISYDYIYSGVGHAMFTCSEKSSIYTFVYICYVYMCKGILHMLHLSVQRNPNVCQYMQRNPVCTYLLKYSMFTCSYMHIFVNKCTDHVQESYMCQVYMQEESYLHIFTNKSMLSCINSFLYAHIRICLHTLCLHV